MKAADAPLPPPEKIGHLGLVVKDLEKTMEFLSSIWEIGPWQSFEFTPGADDLLAGKPCRLMVGQAPIGTTILELVEPLSGDNIWADFRDEHGEGLHHIAFVVKDWEATVARFEQAGIPMIVGGIADSKHWGYFATTPGGLLAEINEA
jgi:4-hydroxyphenylpyruvate dioxygenase-like putative hemolysin